MPIDQTMALELAKTAAEAFAAAVAVGIAFGLYALWR